MFSKTVVVLLMVVPAISLAQPASPLVLKKSHGAFCHLCEDLIKDGKEAGDVALDVWLDEEIGSRCKDFGVLASECFKELKVAEHDIWEAIDQEIPEDKTCKEAKLC
ncbi:Saposin B-type domain-containing protein [Caenorhabditis elegans]|uniref:Saposin B-type domain-containing protein n=1 Tax=Caenorhabditis elegans TaxID=6239 RepID=Q9XVI5_CAEEL|nr:Saposin B-type domain-containing protein [Caenorhabditis elegans]CAB03392.1 Saposin B-type domain-containing protein [Caenorhabditis elegans]|eukprot:NP_506443.1 SaPosin-like Protein family [Caenorhabditis elegans]